MDSIDNLYLLFLNNDFDKIVLIFSFMINRIKTWRLGTVSAVERVTLVSRVTCVCVSPGSLPDTDSLVMRCHVQVINADMFIT